MGIDHSRPEVLYEVQRVDGHICSLSRDKDNPQFMCIREENLRRAEETCHTIDISNGETLDVCYRNRNFTPGRQNGGAFTPVISSDGSNRQIDSPREFRPFGRNQTRVDPDRNRVIVDPDRDQTLIGRDINIPFGIPGNRDKCTNITVNQYLGQRPETRIIGTEQNGPVTQPVPNEMTGQVNQSGQNGQTFPINQTGQNGPIIQNGQMNQSCQNGPISQNGSNGRNGPTGQINGTPAIFENTRNNDNLGWSPTRLEYTDNLSIISRNNGNSVVNPLNRSELRRLT